MTSVSVPPVPGVARTHKRLIYGIHLAISVQGHLCLHLSEEFEVDAATLGQIAPNVIHWISEDGHVEDVVLAWNTDAWSFLVLTSAIGNRLRQQYTRSSGPIVVAATVRRGSLSMFKVDECVYQDLATPGEYTQGDYDNEGPMVLVLQPHSYRNGK